MRVLKALVAGAGCALLPIGALAQSENASEALSAAPPVLKSGPRAARPHSAWREPLPALTLSRQAADKVGRQVWLNETGGNRDMITAWNAGEDFASVGIGHFIWFPAGLKTPFAESFPKVAVYLRARGARLPAWIDKQPIPACPWQTRAEFKRQFHSPEMVALREFLLATVGLQAEYLAHRMREAMPKMLASLDDAADKDRVRAQFIRVAKASPDLYPLIDYVNFKGEGIALTETFPDQKTGRREGWGLKHVLLAMRGNPRDAEGALEDFADAAAFVLNRRIANHPPSKRWRAGWMKRTETYRRPLR